MYPSRAAVPKRPPAHIDGPGVSFRPVIRLQGRWPCKGAAKRKGPTMKRAHETTTRTTRSGLAECGRKVTEPNANTAPLRPVLAAPAAAEAALAAAQRRAVLAHETLWDGAIDGPADAFLAAHDTAPEAAAPCGPAAPDETAAHAALWTLAEEGRTVHIDVSMVAFRGVSGRRHTVVSDAFAALQAAALAGCVPVALTLTPGAGRRPPRITVSSTLQRQHGPLYCALPTVLQAAPLPLYSKRRPAPREAAPVLIYGRNGGREAAAAAEALRTACTVPDRWAALHLAALAAL